MRWYAIDVPPARLWILLALLSSFAPAVLAATPSKKPLSSYGAISVGHPSAGFLLNAKRMPEGKDWVLTAPRHAYATDESIEQLGHCLTRVRTAIPGSPPVMLGSLSGREGGRIPPHDSHRTGRDADVYFFRRPGATWNEAATRDDLDLPRTWALLRCFITDADIDFVLIDRTVQGWIEAYALAAGEPAVWVRSLFHDDPGPWGPQTNHAVVRHAPGHVAHMHVRFVSPKARRLAAELYERLVREGKLKGQYASVHYRVRRGDTLGALARRYRTSVAALQQQNGLKSTRIRVGQNLLVRQPVALKGVKEAVVVPKRRQPEME